MEDFLLVGGLDLAKWVRRKKNEAAGENPRCCVRTRTLWWVRWEVALPCLRVWVGKVTLVGLPG